MTLAVYPTSTDDHVSEDTLDADVAHRFVAIVLLPWTANFQLILLSIHYVVSTTFRFNLIGILAYSVEPEAIKRTKIKCQL